jgi:signal transduction histidine kinase
VWRSLRFKLPALFLIGIVLSGVIAAATAVGLVQNYVEDRTRSELRQNAAGLAHLYETQAIEALDQDRGPVPFARRDLEAASGNRLYYVGPGIFLKGQAALRPLPQRYVPNWRLGKVETFEFVPPGTNEKYFAVAHPLKLEKQALYGALVVATPKDQLRERWITLMERLGIAFLVGIAIAGALGWYLSRRITKPVLALADAADQVAAGNYTVELPPPGHDEIGELSVRFGEMARRLSEVEELERNFLMSVSHELRTPLTAIRGHVGALREGLAEDPEARARSLEVIATEAGRLERLVGDVLDLAKLDARRFTVLHEEVDMGRLLEQAYESFGEEARRRGIDYRSELTARPVIVSDGDRVLQIISNLLANAFRWTPDGGRVDVELSQTDGTVSVAVADTGPGIPAAERERIFRPFVSQDGAGTGLGLAIARELARALGGRIRLESEPGHGSRFELVLPAARSADAAPEAQVALRSSNR